MDLNAIKSMIFHRPRILWLVLGAMLLVSLLPLGLYHRQVLQLSQAKLTDTESVQQTEVTRSLGEEIQQFDGNLYQQLISERQILALTGLIDKVDIPQSAPQLSRVLENFVASNPNILYLTAVGQGSQGQRSRKFSGQSRSFCVQGFAAGVLHYHAIAGVLCSDPLAIGPENRPAFVMAVPLQVNDQFSGMLAAVVSLDGILRRLQETSVRGRVVFVVDHSGHIVAHPDSRQFVPGSDAKPSSPVVMQVTELPKGLRTTETLRRFESTDDGSKQEMVGTYSTIPDLNWAVVATRGLDKAREDAGVKELNAQALKFVIVVTFAARVLGYFFAVGISTPIRALSPPSTLAISRGEFHQRTPVQGAAENQRAGRNIQPHGRRHRRVRRTAAASRRSEPRSLSRLHSHARSGHRRKGSLHARPFRARGQIFHPDCATVGHARGGTGKDQNFSAAARRGKNRSGRSRAEKAGCADHWKNSR